MLEPMRDDILKTRAVIIQGCMLMASAYRDSVIKKMKLGVNVSSSEFKIAYEILKTEL